MKTKNYAFVLSRLLALFVLMTIQTGLLANGTTKTVCPVVRMEAVRLPDLNIPRSGHSLFVVNGEPTVVGGHTSGFVPTATAEYYRDGEWHLMETVYIHDHGLSVPLQSGEVLIGGGHAEPLGIGHIYSVEMYDPVSHSFRGFGCLDTKRCFANGVELDSGRVVISGNWYQSPDGIELFDGQKYFTAVKGVSQSRSRPYVLPISKDDVLIFSGADEHADPIDTIIVDRLRGEPFRVPLLNEWKPLICEEENYFAGDERQDNYSYLIPLENKDRQVAICCIEGTRFSLLPTDCSIPMEWGGAPIRYNSYMNVDRKNRRAFLFGNSLDNGNVFVLAADLSTTPVSLKLYYTEQTANIVYARSVLMPNGDILLAGGMGLNADRTVDNFSPHAITLLLRVGDGSEAAFATTTSSHTIWLWVVLGLLVIVAIVAILAYRFHKHQESRKSQNYPQAPPTSDLMLRLQQLMDDQKAYLNSELKLQDVADMLNTNRTYLADCIKADCGQTFTQFVNTYRVECAKQLLSQYPDRKMSAVATESGFATEASFFRNFKAQTGTTPKEWQAEEH